MELNHFCSEAGHEHLHLNLTLKKPTFCFNVPQNNMKIWKDKSVCMCLCMSVRVWLWLCWIGPSDEVIYPYPALNHNEWALFTPAPSRLLSTNQTAGICVTSASKHDHAECRDVLQELQAHCPRTQSESCSRRNMKQSLTLNCSRGCLEFWTAVACLCFFFLKNDYPGKERASKDTHLQVTKLVLDLNICVSVLSDLIPHRWTFLYNVHHVNFVAWVGFG